MKDETFGTFDKDQYNEDAEKTGNLSMREIRDIMQKKNQVDPLQEFEKGLKETESAEPKDSNPSPITLEDFSDVNKQQDNAATSAQEQENEESSDNAESQDSQKDDALNQRITEELEAMKTQITRLALENEKWKTLASRHAGAAGHWKQLAEKGNQSPEGQAAPQNSFFDEYRGDEAGNSNAQQSQQNSYPQSNVDPEELNERIEMAQEKAYSSFLQKYPNADTSAQEFQEQFLKVCKEDEFLREELASKKPSRIRKALGFALEHAQLNVSELKRQQANQHLQQRQSKETSQLEKDKLQESASKGSSSGQKTQKKSISEMSTEELAKIINMQRSKSSRF